MKLLKSKNLQLRALELEDVDVLYQWENDTGLWVVSNTTTPFSKYFLQQFIINSHNDIYTDKQLRLMIELVNNNTQPIGSIDLFDFDPKNLRAGIGILIAEKYRSKGYGSEALDTVIEYCRKVLNMHQLYCNIGEDNPESLKLFQNKGFKIIGKKKHWIRKDDDWIDEYMLQLVFEGGDE